MARLEINLLLAIFLLKCATLAIVELVGVVAIGWCGCNWLATVGWQNCGGLQSRGRIRLLLGVAEFWMYPQMLLIIGVRVIGGKQDLFKVRGDRSKVHRFPLIINRGDLSFLQASWSMYSYQTATNI